MLNIFIVVVLYVYMDVIFILLNDIVYFYCIFLKIKMFGRVLHRQTLMYFQYKLIMYQPILVLFNWLQ